jgi:hypothetical protein
MSRIVYEHPQIQVCTVARAAGPSLSFALEGGARDVALLDAEAAAELRDAISAWLDGDLAIQILNAWRDACERFDARPGADVPGFAEWSGATKDLLLDLGLEWDAEHDEYKIGDRRRPAVTKAARGAAALRKRDATSAAASRSADASPTWSEPCKFPQYGTRPNVVYGSKSSELSQRCIKCQFPRSAHTFTGWEPPDANPEATPTGGAP